jgi:hypothetical protein
LDTANHTQHTQSIFFSTHYTRCPNQRSKKKSRQISKHTFCHIHTGGVADKKKMAATPEKSKEKTTLTDVENALVRDNLNGARTLLANMIENCDRDAILARFAMRTLILPEEDFKFTSKGVTTGWEDMVPKLSNWLSQPVVFEPLNQNVLHVLLTSPANCGMVPFVQQVCQRYKQTLLDSLTTPRIIADTSEGATYDKIANTSPMLIDLRAWKQTPVEEIRKKLLHIMDCAQKIGLYLSVYDVWINLVVLTNLDSWFTDENDVAPVVDTNIDEQILMGVGINSNTISRAPIITPQAATPEAQFNKIYMQKIRDEDASLLLETGVSGSVANAVKKEDKKAPPAKSAVRKIAESVTRAVTSAIGAAAVLATGARPQDLKAGGDAKSERYAALTSMLQEIFSPASLQVRFPNLKFLWTTQAPWSLPTPIQKMMQLHYPLGPPNATLRQIIVHKQIAANLNNLGRVLPEKNDNNRKIVDFSEKIAQLTGATHRAKCQLEINYCMDNQTIDALIKKLHMDPFESSSSSVDKHLWGANFYDTAMIAQKWISYKINQVLMKLVDAGEMGIDQPSGKYLCKTVPGKKCEIVTTPQAAYNKMFPENGNYENLYGLFDTSSKEDEQHLREIVLDVMSPGYAAKDRGYPLFLGWALADGQMSIFERWRATRCPDKNHKTCEQLFDAKRSTPKVIPLTHPNFSVKNFEEVYANQQANEDKKGIVDNKAVTVTVTKEQDQDQSPMTDAFRRRVPRRPGNPNIPTGIAMPTNRGGGGGRGGGHGFVANRGPIVIMGRPRTIRLTKHPDRGSKWQEIHLTPQELLSRKQRAKK